ncbi:MAG TPA: hypothetical protein ENN29_03280 [Candidatus Hydrogenedentes bacterium]|nr:hypothetical protein [Candidatus Hydrogenedentota bacterium]
MNLPAEALRDLRRCGHAVFRYVVASIMAVMLFRFFSYAGRYWLPEEAQPQLSAIIQLAGALYLAVAVSAVQAVYFSVLGAAIDKPLWKHKGAVDALQRFFTPWLIINLLIITLTDIQTRFLAAEMNDIAALIEFSILAVSVAAIPVGGCIMHWGGLEWNELAEALRPLGRLFSQTLLPVAAGFALYALASARMIAVTGNMLVDMMFLTGTDIPLFMLEAYVFAMVWRICMHHRTLPPEDNDPFDF